MALEEPEEKLKQEVEEEKLFAPTNEEGAIKGVPEWTEAEVWAWLQTLPYASKLNKQTWDFVSGTALADLNSDKLEILGVYGPVIERLLSDANKHVVAVERKKIELEQAANESEEKKEEEKPAGKDTDVEITTTCGCIPTVKPKPKPNLEQEMVTFKEGEVDERHVIKVQIFVNSVIAVESSTESWYADFWVRSVWTDDYLFTVRKSGETFRADWDDPGWFQPKLEVVNSRELDLILEQRFVEGDEIFCEQRWRGTLHSDMDLRLFPFDRQRLRIDVESSFHATKFIHIVSAVPNAALYSRNCAKNPEFKVLRGDLVNSNNKLEFITEDDAVFQRYSLVLTVERRSGFYVARVGFLNVICVLIGTSIDFIDPSNPGKRLGITTTMFLTLVAFQFAVAESMPKISYFTLLDYMVLICYFVMGATIIQSIVQYNRFNNGEDPDLLFEADLNGFIALVAILFGSVACLSFYGLRSWMKGILFMAGAGQA